MSSISTLLIRNLEDVFGENDPVRRVVRPEPLLDFSAGDDLAPTFNQHPKNLEWLFPQNDPALAFGPNGAQFTRVQVKFNPPKANATQQIRFHDHIEGSVDEVVSPFDVAF